MIDTSALLPRRLPLGAFDPSYPGGPRPTHLLRRERLPEELAAAEGIAERLRGQAAG
jgi:hypothetical protein